MAQEPLVRSYMRSDVIAFTPEMDVLRAMRLLIDHEIAGAPVIDAQGQLIGLLSERDCLRIAFPCLYHGEPAGNVAQYMTREVETVPPDMPLALLVEKFYQGPHRRFPVVEGRQLVGQISRRDALRAMLDRY